MVTYNVAIEVSNPEEKLKPGMTTNLTFTIDERSNVLKVPNAALRFTPQDASGQRGERTDGRNNRQGGNRGSSQDQTAVDAGGSAAAQNRAQRSGEGGERASNFAPPSAPVLQGQTRIVWVMGQDGKPQRRRITVGLSDGVATEVTDGNLQEGEMVVTSETIASGGTSQRSQTTTPGFGGTPRTPGGGGGGRR